MTQPRFPGPGGHTAYGGILDYRLEKIARLGALRGEWLDLGCADGYYSVGLAERGATSVLGIDVNPRLVARASELAHPKGVSFLVADGDRLAFDDDSFDGVLLNEVLEHVEDDMLTVREIARVLRPGGVLALFSPNRWFPFEGHGARLSETRVLLSRPVPLMPWLPKRLTSRFATARNYWPHELTRLVLDANLEIITRSWALAQFEQYPWIPDRAAHWYRSNVARIERSPVARFLAVSTLVFARSAKQPARA
jgi:SAM-dependent methyltransferase